MYFFSTKSILKVYEDNNNNNNNNDDIYEYLYNNNIIVTITDRYDGAGTSVW